MIFSKRLLLLSVAIYLCNGLFGTATAELVDFEFTGRTQARVGNDSFDDVDFTILVSIENTAQDQFPFQNGRGAFSGATTTLSIPDAGIFDAVSTNVTGILQEDFGNSRFRLVDSNNFFSAAALGLTFNGPGVIPDVTSINPFSEPLPTPSSFEAGLEWEFLLGPNVTFNTVLEVSVANVSVSANVPEPSSFFMAGGGLLSVSLWRRRRIRRR